MESMDAKKARGRPRANPDQIDGVHPRERIVAEASALFSERGVDAVTMQDIATRAGLRQSSIYYWFRSKAEILASILEQVNRVPLEIVERERTASGPVAVRLYRLVREDVLALCGFPFDINAIHRLAMREPDEFQRYVEERRQLDREVAELVADGVRSGEFRQLDVDLAARTILANDEATQNWFRFDAVGTTAETVADHVALTALCGLLEVRSDADLVLRDVRDAD